MIGENAASANLMKLAANALTATMLVCMGEVLALLRKSGIDHHLADDVLTNSLGRGRASSKHEELALTCEIGVAKHRCRYIILSMPRAVLGDTSGNFWG